MRDSLPLLNTLDFPPLRRGALDTLQVNLTYRCNQRCLHCHVNAGPTRTESMSAELIELLGEVIDAHPVDTLDLTGGAPEMHPQFRTLVRRARAAGIKVIDRCNLTILSEPGHEDLAEFLAGEQERARELRPSKVAGPETKPGRCPRTQREVRGAQETAAASARALSSSQLQCSSFVDAFATQSSARSQFRAAGPSFRTSCAAAVASAHLSRASTRARLNCKRGSSLAGA